MTGYRIAERERPCNWRTGYLMTPAYPQGTPAVSRTRNPRH